MKNPLSLTLTLLLSAAILFLPTALAQNEAPPQKRSGLTRPGDEDLGRVFRSYERLSLDTADAAERVRQTGRLVLNTGSRTFDLELEPHDMRADHYRAEQTVAPGVTLPVARGPVRTYKGKVRGSAGAQARFTIDEESFEGVILTKGERYYVEPASRYTPGATRADFLLYKGSDVIESEPLSCAAPSLHDKLNEAAGKVSEEPSVSAAVTGGGPEPQVLASPLEAELATEADFEYSTALGGAAGANNEIQSIMNQVEGVYQTEIGLSFKIAYQHVWTTSADPYTSADPVTAIKEFTNEWNNDPHGVGFKTVVRDVAHMWTGKNLTNTAGVAWTGVVCKSPASAYALSERISISPQKIILPAHEIGHTFNATHTDGTAGCTNTIMQAIARDTSVVSFCPASRGQIETHIRTYPSCLSAAPACTFTLSPTSAVFTSAGGSASFSVTASDAGCNWAAASNAPWIHITAGASGTGSGSVSYTVDANTGATSRSGTITAAGKTFNVSQGAPAACTFT
ncbi:MAG TPA: M12 family metallo-peptidase, partial [Pyrinomonadaceae bacterium]|nr:M12 family metallo-peptidase [Pyrinomonadaceae bacterium]